MWNICAVKHDIIFLGIEVLNSQGKFHSVIFLWFIINPSNSLNVVCEFLHYLDCSLNFYLFGQSLDLNKKLFLWKRWLHETFLSICSEQISFWGAGGESKKKGSFPWNKMQLTMSQFPLFGILQFRKSLPHCLIFVGWRNFASLLFKKISAVFVAKDIMEQPVSLSNGIPLLLCFANEQ